MDVLKKHYEPKPLIIAERYTFNQRNQRSGESVAEYVAELRRLASTCKFGTFLDDALRDRLVRGLRSDSARRRILADAEGEISLAMAIEHAQRDELAEQNSRALKDSDAALKKLSPASRQDRSNRGHTTQRKACYRCGRRNHAAKDCRFADATCNYCHKKGHIAPACLKKKNASGKNTKHVAAVSDESDSDASSIDMVKSSSAMPIMVTLHVEGKALEMEVDTGAAYSVIYSGTSLTLESSRSLSHTSLFCIKAPHLCVCLQFGTRESAHTRVRIIIIFFFSKQNISLPESR